MLRRDIKDHHRGGSSLPWGSSSLKFSKLLQIHYGRLERDVPLSSEGSDPSIAQWPCSPVPHLQNKSFLITQTEHARRLQDLFGFFFAVDFPVQFLLMCITQEFQERNPPPPPLSKWVGRAVFIRHSPHCWKEKPIWTSGDLQDVSAREGGK